MATLFQKIKFFFKKKEIKHIELDPESVKKWHNIRILANENAELKARLARLESKEGKRQEREEQREQTEEMRLELNKQKRELDKKNSPWYFSLKTFFNKTRTKKFKNLAYYDFMRSKKLGRFGDFGFAFDGDFIIMDDKGEILMKAPDLNTIFQSVAGLGNDVPSLKIPLNVNGKGEYVENPMTWEVPEFVPAGGGKFQWSKARKKPFYDYLTELRQQIQDQHEDIEKLELVNTELQNENDELNVAIRVAGNSANTARKELGTSEQRVSAIDTQFREIANELAQVRGTNTVLEKEIEDIEEKLEELKSKSKEEGIALKFDDVVKRINKIKGLLKEKTIMVPKEQVSEPVTPK